MLNETKNIPIVLHGDWDAEIFALCAEYPGSAPLIKKYEKAIVRQHRAWQISCDLLDAEETKSLISSVTALCERIVFAEKGGWRKKGYSSAEIAGVEDAIRRGERPAERRVFALWSQIYSVIETQYPLVMDVWVKWFREPAEPQEGKEVKK